MSPEAPPFAVVTSEWVPQSRGYLVAYRGRQPECTSHTPHVTHWPCWSVTRVDFGDGEATAALTARSAVVAMTLRPSPLSTSGVAGEKRAP